VSLLSTKRLEAIIGHDYVVLNTLSIGFSTKLLVQKYEFFQADDSTAPLAFIPALKLLLHSSQVNNVSLDVSLMSDYVLYTALPPQVEAMQAAEQEAYAKAAFEQLFGEVAQQWQVAVQIAPPGNPTICAAMAQTITEALVAMADEAQVKLNTVSPYINTVTGAFARELKKALGYLVVIEQNRLVLMQLTKGQVTSIKSEVLEQDWALLLKQMLIRSTLTNAVNNQAAPTVYIHAPLLQLSRGERLNNLELQGWNVQWLQEARYDLTQISNKAIAA